MLENRYNKRSRYYCTISVINLERRTILRAGLAVIVDAGGGDVGVTEPLLDLGDVGLVVQRIGGGRRAITIRI